ncbi:hypothetical protein K239x_35780 [Planctomycetes bacterium K23_9]|uniref:Uncharacterized protein n=1 Tax=Stieleria marina TaxID=1930275 RepID=A0A517NWU2_9BACT|nr:hypothetical protein K239x_35780 [Planctomycetes bacterium K23_9]
MMILSMDLGKFNSACCLENAFAVSAMPESPSFL